MGFKAESTYVGFNSLDYEVQLGIRNKLTESNIYSNSDQSYLKVLCISRLTKICRYDILFKSIALANINHGTKIQVQVIGSGPELLFLQDLVDELKLEVNFLGAIYDEEKIAPYIYNADVTISPGKVGLTAMHSLMYGTPVISHDDLETQMPEVEAIVSGYTGQLFVKDNVNNLSEKLHNFKSLFNNRELTRRRCFSMIDDVYNPINQVKVLTMALQGIPAHEGDDAFVLFEEDAGA